MMMAATYLLAIATAGSVANLRARSPWLMALANGLAALGFALLYLSTK